MFLRELGFYGHQPEDKMVRRTIFRQTYAVMWCDGDTNNKNMYSFIVPKELCMNYACIASYMYCICIICNVRHVIYCNVFSVWN